MLKRPSRHLNLTEAGRLYVEVCKGILEQVEGADRAAIGVHKDPKGRLTVTAPVVFGCIQMIPITSEFLAEYPDIDVKLALTGRLLDPGRGTHDRNRRS
jgi:DNA-binding transcriptional LysR family regulator